MFLCVGLFCDSHRSESRVYVPFYVSPIPQVWSALIILPVLCISPDFSVSNHLGTPPHFTADYWGCWLVLFLCWVGFSYEKDGKDSSFCLFFCHKTLHYHPSLSQHQDLLAECTLLSSSPANCPPFLLWTSSFLLIECTLNFAFYMGMVLFLAGSFRNCTRSNYVCLI